MYHFIKRWLLLITIAAVTQVSTVNAEVIRLIGPSGEEQNAPNFSREIVRQSPDAAQPSRFYGPTSEQETLWSIATQLRPSSDVSVQQTLLAIYRLNPQAFENQNLHSLIPGSTLRIPSRQQITRSSTEEAVNIMTAHQARLVPDTPPVAQIQAPIVQAPEQPTLAQQPEAVIEPPVETATPIPEPVPEPVDVNTSLRAAEVTQTELMALEEKNHQMRLLLAQMQSQVSELKHELDEGSRIRAEVERLLAEQARPQTEVKPNISSFEQLLSKTWFVGLLALIPGLIIGGAVLYFLNRRKSAEQSDPESANTQDVAPVLNPEQQTIQDDEDLLSDDDIIIDDDLFGESEPKEELYGDDMGDEDVFASLDDTELNLGDDEDDPFAGIDDDGDLDANFTESLENETDQIEQLESEQNNTDQEETEPLSQDEMNALLEGEDDLLTDGGLDQSMLDDLLMEEDIVDEDLNSEPESTLDERLEAADQQNQVEQSSSEISDEQLLADIDDQDLDLSLDDSTESLDELLDANQSDNQGSGSEEDPEPDAIFDEELDSLLQESDSGEEAGLEPDAIFD